MENGKGVVLDPSKGPQGTFFDKPAPTGPPTPAKRQIPAHLAPIVRFFEGIVSDEALLLDLCLDKAVGMVEQSYNNRAHGSDFFAENQPSAMHYTQVAGPLAVELYKQVLQSVKDRADEYVALVNKANEERKLAQERQGPTILRP